MQSFEEFWNEHSHLNEDEAYQLYLEGINEDLPDLSDETIDMQFDSEDFYAFCNERYENAYKRAVTAFIENNKEIVSVLEKQKLTLSMYKFDLYKANPRKWVNALEKDDCKDLGCIYLHSNCSVYELIKISSDCDLEIEPFICSHIFSAISCVIALKKAKNEQVKAFALHNLLKDLEFIKDIPKVLQLIKIARAQKSREKGKRKALFRADYLADLQKKCGGKGVKSKAERKIAFTDYCAKNNMYSSNFLQFIPVFVWDILVPFFDDINILADEQIARKLNPLADRFDFFEVQLKKKHLDRKLRDFYRQNEKELTQGGKAKRQFNDYSDFIMQLRALLDTYKEIKKAGLW